MAPTAVAAAEEAGAGQVEPANQRCGNVLLVSFAEKIGPVGVVRLRIMTGKEKSGILSAQTPEQARGILNDPKIVISAVALDGRRVSKRVRKMQADFIALVNRSFPSIRLMTVSEADPQGKASRACNDHVIAGCESTTWCEFPALIRSFTS